MQELTYIDTSSALAAWLPRLEKRAWFAIDTEFERSKTYYPQLCLLQVADGEAVACIDPLAIDDLSPLAALLSSPKVLKVFHAASQDMEVLHTTLGVMPSPVFDTQLAATLLGYPDQIGYARLVKAVTGTELEKAHTRADWCRRPLSTDELEYAADDVRYLCAVYEYMSAELNRRGRREWLEDDLNALADPGRYANLPEEAFRRVRGWTRLRPGQQQALLRLAAWREHEAMARNRPRRWIVKDDILLDAARRRPESVETLGRIRGVTDTMVQRYGEAMLNAIEAGRRAPPEPLDRKERRLNPEQEPVVDALMAALRQCAAEADLAPAVLATRKDLERLVAGERNLALLTGWRRRAAGARLLEILEGKTALRVREGRLRLEGAKS